MLNLLSVLTSLRAVSGAPHEKLLLGRWWCGRFTYVGQGVEMGVVGVAGRVVGEFIQAQRGGGLDSGGELLKRAWLVNARAFSVSYLPGGG